MSDDYIRDLQQDWRTQTCDVDAVARRLRRNRWTPHIVLATEILGCLAALVGGVWFGWWAVQHPEHRLLFVLSAFVMLTSAPVLAIVTINARRRALAWADETPESLLQVGLRRAEASLAAVGIARWHLAILSAFIAVLWIVELLGLTHARGFVIFYTVFCVALSVPGWFWLRHRERRLQSERRECESLLRALRVE